MLVVLEGAFEGRFIIIGECVVKILFVGDIFIVTFVGEIASSMAMFLLWADGRVLSSPFLLKFDCVPVGLICLDFKFVGDCLLNNEFLASDPLRRIYWELVPWLSFDIEKLSF